MPPIPSHQRLQALKKRADFLAANKGARIGAGSFLLLQAPCVTGETRIGFTVTKKLGKAVRRNRIRRRLKEATRQIFPGRAPEGFDYVIIARPAAETRAFALLLDDMKRALLRLSAPPPS